MTTAKRSEGMSPHPSSAIAAQIAAATPHYDPLKPPKNRRGAILGTFSVLLHVGLLVLLWNVLFGDPLEPEETILVSMLEEEKPPEPEPQKARPKAIQRRVINAASRQFKKVIQNEIRVVSPKPRVATPEKVEIAKVQKVEAPKVVERTQREAKVVNEFAEVQVQEPVSVPQATVAPRQVTQLQSSAGPRQLPEAGPVVDSAAQYTAPNLRDGAVDMVAAQGDPEGARIPTVESGLDKRLLDGSGDKLGLQPGQNKDCNKDPVCLAYLEEIQRRVYRRWRPGGGVPGGRVRLAFRIDKSGAAYQVRLDQADNDVLGETCATAFRQASPFPPPPKQILYLTNKGIVASFFYESGSSE